MGNGGRLFARTHRGVPSPSELEPTVTTSLECRVPGAQPSWRVKPSTRDGPGAASPKSTRWIVRPPPSPRPKSKLSGLTSLCTYLYKESNKTHVPSGQSNRHDDEDKNKNGNVRIEFGAWEQSGREQIFNEEHALTKCCLLE